ncbi:hypothetical protein ACEQPO_31450 [Bacillus sp. SL00103]
MKNIWHESTVSGTKVSIKELTHSLHPKPIDSNKPRLFAPAEGASPKIGGRGFEYLRSNGLTVGGFGQSPKRVTREPVLTYAPK